MVEGVTSLRSDPALVRFRIAVGELYGPRLNKILLFGSRARGDARPDSDYDLAVFLDRDLDQAAERKQLADIGTDILFDTGRVLNAIPFDVDDFSDRTLLMHEIRREGVEL